MPYLFSSPHSYLDYASGAAISTRSALRAFVRQGDQVDVFCGTYFDDPQMNERAFFRLLKSLNARIKVTELQLKDGVKPRSFRLVEFDDSGINASFLLAEDSFRASNRFFPMNSISNRLFFHFLIKKLDATSPDVFATNGGDPRLILSAKRAKANGGASVFLLYNLAYSKRELFLAFDKVVVPSEYARRFYLDRLDVDSVVVPPTIEEESVVAKERTPQYLTFVNPTVEKGLYWFVGIARALRETRPDVPILIVEGRSQWRDLVPQRVRDELTNVRVMSNVAAPREFYAVTKLLIAPSLVEETFGRVVVEAAMNGVPVVASDRGALAELVEDSSVKLPIPKRFTPTGGKDPTLEELRPWLDAILALWDGSDVPDDDNGESLPSFAKR
ncbi:MAG: glycosyltransferase family 4 protein [Thermoguttaceae bacterium]|nr:glycosyltransferase family 4 protein [Thermoguttaceae bacterium]